MMRSFLTAVVLMALTGETTSSYVAPTRLVASHRARSITLAEQPDEEKGGFFRNPFQQRGVPAEFQPVRELLALRQAPFYGWAELGDEGYRNKIAALYGSILVTLSLPISYTTYEVLPAELPQLLLTATIGTSGVVLPFVLRLRNGWGFVSKRLKEPVSYYEKNEEGFQARKDPEIRARDRLIEKRDVAPVIKRVDQSVLAVGASLILAIASLDAITAIQGESGPLILKTLTGDDAIRYQNRLRSDDVFAAREQKRLQDKARKGDVILPGYCDSRYYKILAGGNGQGGVGCSR